MFFSRLACLSATLLLISSFCTFAEDKPEAKKVDSPDFKNWSKFKVGTYVTVISTTEADGKKSESKMWYTLKTVGEDTLTVENETAQPENVKVKTPPVSRDFPKTIEADAKSIDSVKAGKPSGTTEEGSETIKVGGTEFKCTWYKFRINTTSGPISAQLWVNDDVPGRMVRVKTVSRQATTVAEVTEIVKK